MHTKLVFFYQKHRFMTKINSKFLFSAKTNRDDTIHISYDK